MQASGRARSPNEPARFAPRPVPPPLPGQNVRGPAYGETPSPDAVDPKWLEDAVLRILEKHAKGSLVADASSAMRARRAPSRARERAWVVARTALIVIAVGGAVFSAARWRYPVKTAETLGAAQTVISRIPPPSSWLASITPNSPAKTAPPFVAPSVPAVPAVPSPPSVAPITVTPPATTASAPEAKAIANAALPSVAPQVAEKGAMPAAPATKIEARHSARAPHEAHHAPVAAPVAGPVAAPAADPVADAPPPIPGPLGEAIKRASGGRLVTAPADRAPTPDAKKAPDATLVDRPAASLVNSAIMSALPDARACLNAGDDVTQAVIVFESSGAVSSVQVSGAAASCIQKAFRNARVPPFAQATYRAGVPVRPR